MDVLKEFEVLPINCLWLDPDELIRLIKLMREQDETRNWMYTKRPLNLKDIYFPAPPKGGAHLPKFAVWRPSNMFFGSVLIPNYGDELIQLMRHLNRRFKIRYFSAHLSQDHKAEGTCRFEHADESGTTRVVHVILDSGWQFYEKGAILPFENRVHYEKRRIVDRLTPAIVIEYLACLGWNLEDKAFWKSNGDAWIAEKTRFK